MIMATSLISLRIDDNILHSMKTNAHLLHLSQTDYIRKAIEHFNKETEQQEQYNLNLCCLQNALGMAFGGSKFKPVNPFESAKSKKRVHKVSKKEKEENLNSAINDLL